VKRLFHEKNAKTLGKIGSVDKNNGYERKRDQK
jgi:hypothetical protein